MKRKLLPLVALGVAVLSGCGKTEKTMVRIQNELTPEEVAAGVFTPEVMWKMERIASSSVSPDGSKVVYASTSYVMDDNKGFTTLWLAGEGGSGPIQLTGADVNSSDPSWDASGESIYFLSDRSGSGQLWRIGAGGGQAVQVTDVEEGIDGYGVSPKGNYLFYVQRVKVTKFKSADIFTDMDKSAAMIYDDLMARHWEYWDDGSYLHIFVAPMAGGKAGEGIDIMEGEPWDAPLAPYFDCAEIAWNNSGSALAYTCKKMTGRDYAVSTNSDIYIYDPANHTTQNVTAGMKGYDKYPVFSPDDTRLAFISMERDGNESDKERLMVANLLTGDMKYLTEGFDYNASNAVWDGGETVWFLSPIEATHQLCRVKIGGDVEVVTAGDHDINRFTKSGDRIVAEVTKITMATELFSIGHDGGMEQLSNVNGRIYDNIAMSAVQKRWVTTTDGKQMLVWVVLPPGFDPSKKYPALLYCQGGPQSVVSQFWSYRWNFQLMASQGYIVVAPNRRGLPSFGQEWLDQISGDYSGQNIRDYLSAIDNVSQEPWVDRERLGCVGASYGGYSVFYLAGHHEKRFKAFISHCGIFNLESMYGSTEELWFVNNDLGGPYWSDNPVAKHSYENSPHRSVARWDTPILIVTGMKDYRIPYTQSLEAFTAARQVGVPARLVAFENEAHQVFKPQNSMVWNREFFGWLDKYLNQGRP